MGRSWFFRLFGFDESPSALHKTACPLVKTHLSVEAVGSAAAAAGGEVMRYQLTSAVNGRGYTVGAFSCPSVERLRERLRLRELQAGTLGDDHDVTGGIVYQHISVDDIFTLHHTSPGAVFQAASQFNCLEFPNPHCVPEMGVTNYESDRTQGPACALACAAGTVYRNYFVAMKNGAEGQTEGNQINNMDLFEEVVGNTNQRYFTIENGYTFATSDSLARFNRDYTTFDRDKLVSSVRVGLHSDVSVTFSNRKYDEPAQEVLVTQVFVSALSCGYSPVERTELWAPLARIVLDAAYESTILAALLREGAGARGQPVYLSFIGGGVFRNDDQWIADAIARCLWRYRGRALDVRICHFRRVDETMRDRIDRSYRELCQAADIGGR